MTAEKNHQPLTEKEATDIVAAAFPDTERDVEAVQAKMAARLWESESLDELFDSLQGKTSDKLVGKVIEVQSLDWDTYESADRGPIHCVTVSGKDVANGEEIEFWTSGYMVVRFLRKAELLHLLPFKARVEGKKTRSGQTALNLVRP